MTSRRKSLVAQRSTARLALHLQEVLPGVSDGTV
jgi:hypothetical protein